MPDRHAAESDSPDDGDADAATDDAESEASEGVRHPVILPVSSHLARRGEGDSLDPEVVKFIEENSVEHSTTDADADTDDEGVMEPVAVERGIPVINDLKQRLGHWLNK